MDLLSKLNVDNRPFNALPKTGAFCIKCPLRHHLTPNRPLEPVHSLT